MVCFQLFAFRASLRAVTIWVLAGALSGVVPAAGASGVVLIPTHDVTELALQPAPVQQPGTVANSAGPAPQNQSAAATGASAGPQSASTAAAAKHRVPRWVWFAIAAGVAAGAGAGIAAANHPTSKTAASSSSITISVGGATAGAP